MDKVVGSKAYSFFDWVFRLVIVNLLTVLLSFLVVTILPAIVAAYKTIQDYIRGNSENVYRLYFRNFKTYSEKSFFIWIIFILIMGISFISINYYIGIDTENIFASIGFYVMVVMVILVVFTLLHMPLILINFPKLTLMETVRASILVGGKYFITTSILLVIFIGGLALLPILPISVLIGISFPIYLSTTLTLPVYTYLTKIKFEDRFHYEEGDDIDEDNHGN